LEEGLMLCSAMVVMNKPFLKQNSFSGHINEQCMINFVSQEMEGDFGESAHIEAPQSNR
jgi:hypothetical protein